MRLPRVLALLLCASTLALTASGCGGGKTYSGTKPNIWVQTVCGALGDWAQGLKADGDRLNADLKGAADLTVVKTRFVAFLEGAKRSSGALVTRVKAAGAPAVRDGATIQQQLVSGLAGAQGSFTRAVARAKKLSTTDRQAFSVGVQALGGDVQKELTNTATRFSNLGIAHNDSALKKATANEPACTKIKA
jgi:hypothetical protein